MTFKERLPYFLVGLFIGTMIAIFFFGKKNTSFDYGPNARVLKNIRSKERIISSNAINQLKELKLDTAHISQILKNGDVDLGNKIKLDSCLYKYTIEGQDSLKNIVITVANCNTSAIIETIALKQ